MPKKQQRKTDSELRTNFNNIGKAKIAAALANNTQINLLQIVYGDGNGEAYEPNTNMTSLKREVCRASIINKKQYKILQQKPLLSLKNLLKNLVFKVFTLK